MATRRESKFVTGGKFMRNGRPIQWEIRKPKETTIWNVQVWVKLGGQWDQVWYAMYSGPVRRCILRHLNLHKNYATLSK